MTNPKRHIKTGEGIKARGKNKSSAHPKSAGTGHAPNFKSIFSPIKVLFSGIALSVLFMALVLWMVLSNAISRQDEALNAASAEVNAVVTDTVAELSRITGTSSTIIRDNKSKRARGSRVISRSIFNSQVKPLMNTSPFVTAAVFMPKVESAEEALFEAASHAKGLAEYQPPVSPTGNSTWDPRYFPVRFVEWRSAETAPNKNSSVRLFPKSVVAGEQTLATIVNAIERGGIRASELLIHPRGSQEFGTLSGEIVGSKSLAGPANHVFWLMGAVRDRSPQSDTATGTPTYDISSVAGIFGLEISLDQLIDTSRLSPGVMVDIIRPGSTSAVVKRFAAEDHWASGVLAFAGLSSIIAEQSLGFPGQNLTLSIIAHPYLTRFENNLLFFVFAVGALSLGLTLFLSFRMSRITRRIRNDRLDYESRVDEQKHILAASNSKLRHLIESTNVVAWSADLGNKRFSYIGPQIESLTGYPPSTWYSHNFWFHHVHPDDRARVLNDLDKLQTGTFVEREYRLRRADGSVIWVRNSITATAADEPQDSSDFQNGPSGLQGFLIDITDQKKAQTTLRKAKETAEQASRTKSEFLANMSHELRTPLNSVIGFAEILDRELFGPLGNDRYKDYASNIRTSGKHLLELINDILDLSKIESGRFELQEMEVDLLALLKSCHSLLHDKAKREGVHFTLSTDPALPDFYGDGRRTKQILLNLLSNAIKFTDPGGAVSLEAKVVEGKGLYISVRDSGIGIAPEDVAHAMGKFNQIDSSLSRQHNGSGLGLPIAKSLAELHGGKLILNSRLGKGSVVTIWMPEDRMLNQSTENPAPTVEGKLDDNNETGMKEIA